MDAALNAITEQVQHAFAEGRSLNITGGGSKAFYGPQVNADRLDTTPYQGIISYEPTELVITARCGTPLRELTAALAEKGQYLPFEPPQFTDQTTVGGVVATGLSGPRRAAVGAVRDFVLGTRILNGQGQDLHFGGQVMKNVAGFDLSRLMVGALGTLGVILEASFKLLPKPAFEMSLRFSLPEDNAIAQINTWLGRGIPITACLIMDGECVIRLSGFEENCRVLHKDLGGEEVEAANSLWDSLQDHTHTFFANADLTQKRVWRIAVPPATPSLGLSGASLIEWGGAQRWLISDVEPETLRSVVAEKGGHATLFRGATDGVKIFTPMPEALAKLQRRIKHAMDPKGILNPGKIDLES